MVKIDYDYEYDILYIHRENGRAKFSIEVLENFVIDIGFDNKVVGLEIFDASKVLKVAKKELKNIKKARLATIMRKEVYGVIYSIQLEKVNVESQLQIPVAGRLR